MCSSRAGATLMALLTAMLLLDPDSNSHLSISEDANVDGGVTVPNVRLNGIVRGDVCASQRVELGPTARVIGNVYYKSN